MSIVVYCIVLDQLKALKQSIDFIHKNWGFYWMLSLVLKVGLVRYLLIWHLTIIIDCGNYFTIAVIFY